MTEELKPCPFCGEAPKVEQRKTQSLWSSDEVTFSHVACHECEVSGRDFCDDPDGEQAIEWWNNRATLSPAHIEDGEEVEVVAWADPSDLNLMRRHGHTSCVVKAAQDPCCSEPLMTVAQHQRIVGALSAPPAAAVPEGWKLVPMVPTIDMKNAGWREIERQGTDPELLEMRQIYQAAINAAPTPPASEQQQTVQQPHTVEFVGKTCQRVLMAEGKPYPRTCAVCGLSGPCKSFPRENDQRLNPHLAKGEGV